MSRCDLRLAVRAAVLMVNTGKPGRMVTMRRRTLLLSLLATGAVSACADRAITAVSASKAPILASTSASSLAPQSVMPFVPRPGAAPAHSYNVGRRDFPFARGDDRPLPTSVWYPAEGVVPARPAPVDAATPAAGRFPLILFSHGLTSSPTDFEAMLSRWAQAGFVVAGPAFPHTRYEAENFDAEDIVNQPADVRYVLDQLLGGELRPVIDEHRIAAAGHSGGGITTAGLFSAQRDARLTAGLLIAGTDFQGTPFTGPPAAMLFVHGTKDDTVAWSAGRTVFEAVPWSRAMLTIEDGGHVIESDSFEPITRTSTDFWRWALYGDATAKARIPADAAVNGVATLENRL
jgi:dienelactone hydrolase